MITDAYLAFLIALEPVLLKVIISAAVRCALNSAKLLQSEEALKSQMASNIAAAKAEGAKEAMEKIIAMGFHADFKKFRNKENAK